MNEHSSVGSLLIPKELYGNHKKAKAFASRFVKKLCRSDEPRKVMEDVELVQVDLHEGTRLIMQFDARIAMVLPIDSNDPHWRLYAIGPAITYIIDRMYGFDDPAMQVRRLDNGLLAGMGVLWFTLATLNIDWMYLTPTWRTLDEKRRVARLFLTRYLDFLPTIQSLSSHLFFPFHDTMMAPHMEELRYPWAFNILRTAAQAGYPVESGMKALCETGGDIVKLFQAAGITGSGDVKE